MTAHRRNSTSLQLAFAVIGWFTAISLAADRVAAQKVPQPIASYDSAASAGAAALQQPALRQPVVKCPPCEQMHCVPKKASRLKCRGGTTTGICNCCPECAKVENESCGGEWNYLGKCDAGLHCEPRWPSAAAAAAAIVRPRDPVPAVGLPHGLCKKIPNEMMDTDAVGYAAGTPTRDSKPAATCEPKCTPDFCERNPKAVCSAIDVVDLKKDCQGKCQHTACQACYWLEPEPDCGSCPRDDYECIRRFARCVKKRQCSKDKFPCRPRKPGEPAPQGKFQCEVPRCHGR